MPCDNHRRLAIPVQPAPKQAPEERIKNWDEAFLGYTLETAVVEAERCIQCPTAPCQEACPTDNDIPRALLLLEDDDIYGAVRHLHRALAPVRPSARRQQGMLYLLKQYCTQGGCGRCPLS